MFERLSNGWEMAKQSWHVLKQDKELLWFPVFSGIAAMLVLATFVLPMFFFPGLLDSLQNLTDSESNQNAGRIVASVIAFAFYFVNYLVIIYFNTALAACAVLRFRGGDPSVGIGLQMANKRLPQIFAWAFLAATVGFILNMIEEKMEWVGKIVIGLIGFAWTVATYLVVPTLAVEGLGPIEALKRSGGLIRNVWGEGLAGNFSIGLIGFLLVIPAIALIVLAIALNPPTAIAILMIVVAFVYALAVAVVTSALKQIFIAGLYIYATEKKVPHGFDASLLKSAFTPRGR
jgi:hypothetical protein